jgi:crossover junction endodeoxyribonuclease RuvC
MAIETLLFNTNQKTALSVAEARGVIIAQASRLGLDVHQYTPLQVKSAVVGYGRGTKEQIITMVKTLSDIEGNKKTDDEYDAIAIGITCLVSIKPGHVL